ncbi:MAG: ADP-ribosylglycohydrolase family protein [Gemmataceae bacterium]|nr:ADP-ribosylglycohydrolase family protein [Gemmataceae bacterium]
MDHNRLQDRCRGVLLGLAAGDRNGGPIRMALRLAESLLACRAFDPRDVLSRYLAWWHEDGIDTGPTTARVLGLIARGVSAEQAVTQADEECAGLTAGCNPAHRCAPLALAAFLPTPQLPELARVEAALTHRHPLAGEVAAAVACLCRDLVLGVPWARALSAAAAEQRPEVRAVLEAALTEPGGRGGYAPQALQAAAHFVHASAGFGEALERALTFAGPANYCPVLVGALGGGRWGAALIEADLLPRAQGVETLTALADGLAQTWSRSVS